ncbi:hypothetical protein AKO1_002408, partial [Acrasis kona]
MGKNIRSASILFDNQTEDDVSSYDDVAGLLDEMQNDELSIDNHLVYQNTLHEERSKVRAPVELQITNSIGQNDHHVDLDEENYIHRIGTSSKDQTYSERANDDEFWIVVHNFDANVNEDQVQSLFERYGDICDICIFDDVVYIRYKDIPDYNIYTVDKNEMNVDGKVIQFNKINRSDLPFVTKSTVRMDERYKHSHNDPAEHENETHSNTPEPVLDKVTLNNSYIDELEEISNPRTT